MGLSLLEHAVVCTCLLWSFGNQYVIFWWEHVVEGVVTLGSAELVCILVEKTALLDVPHLNFCSPSQPQIGGVARPVQRAAATKEQTPPPDAGFNFLGKSSKTSAFDFVEDEMKATRTKK